ncbi:hypothetical protein [Pseudooceanicola sp.]|uniref:hypothetical protein n=1 Tax=Pseudooceanicola sp. TaxID=1914328 RepID=UPI003515256A
MTDELTRPLASLRQAGLPFYPLILVFATGQVSDEDCMAMKRVPMPELGAPFDSSLSHTLSEAFAKNSSIHDGAIIFTRNRQGEPYTLSAWSMRIVSKKKPRAPEPNFGSAYNSALSLSMAENIDMCCIISPDRTTLFQNGTSHFSET